MKSKVFNSLLGNPKGFDYPKLSNAEVESNLALFFEQLLLFDQVIVSTNRTNYGLAFLINYIGLKNVERLIESKYIKLMIWSPLLLTSKGRQREDGSIDENTIYGQPPIGAGTFGDEDLDPEQNLEYALNNFALTKKEKKHFIKKATQSYLSIDGMEFAKNAEKLVVGAYKANNLTNLGLPFHKEPNQLNLEERYLLQNLGHKVIETAVLSKLNFKSYEDYSHYEILKQNINNIGKAYNISQNNSELFNLENIPNLQQLYIQEKLPFESVFKIRHYDTAKYYRKWINEVGENSNTEEVTEEYINQIKGDTKFFETNKGKFVKTLSLYGISLALTTAVAGPLAGMASPIVVKAIEGGVDIGLDMLETFWLDNLIKGKNPSMFITKLKDEIR